MSEYDNEGMRLAPDGSSFTLYIEVTPIRTDMIPTAELIVQHLADVGIRAALRQVDANVREENLLNSATQTNIYWIQSYQWQPGMEEGYAPNDNWCPAWFDWLETGGEQGVEPPDEVKRLYEIRLERKAALPYSEEDLALADEVD